MQSAYLLVSHGSRDPRPQVAIKELARLVSQRQSVSGNGRLSHSLVNGGVTAQSVWEKLVGTACLELSPMPLHEQIKEFGDRAVAAGYNNIQVVPLFLLPGVHVMEDIPAEVAIAQQSLGQLKIDLRPHLGTHPGLSRLLTADCHADAWILLAHGSRRANSLQPVEAMAKQLQMVEAYWAVPPCLESRVKELVSAGYKQIGIVPYFLFAGGITDAIAQSVEQLRVQFPDVDLLLGEPLGASVQLADLIVDLIEK